MLRTRIWMGSILIAITAGVLCGDRHVLPASPCLLSAIIALGVLASRELRSLLPVAERPPLFFLTAGVLAILLANWFSPCLIMGGDGWHAVVIAASGVVGIMFVMEMSAYRVPGHSVARIAGAMFVFGYLGLLPSFFVKLRWVRPELGVIPLFLALAVPKIGDIAAYFVGRFLGRTPFAPSLSPKKTWEGFFGGLIGSVAVAVGVWLLSAESESAAVLFPGGLVEAGLFGLIVGMAGVLGDLAESMVKRDSQAKDASRSLPGFGGVLDVIDSVLFGAPVVYLWFRR